MAEGNEEEADVSVSVGSSVISSAEFFELLVVIVVLVFEVVLGSELDGEDDEKGVVVGDVLVGDVVVGDEVLDEVEIGDVEGEEMEVDDLVVC